MVTVIRRLLDNSSTSFSVEFARKSSIKPLALSSIWHMNTAPMKFPRKPLKSKLLLTVGDYLEVPRVQARNPPRSPKRRGREAPAPKTGT